MEIKITDNTFFVFDLDDTLFQEIDYLKSAYKSISQKLQTQIAVDIYEEMLHKYQKKENVFQWICDTYNGRLNEVDVKYLLTLYREHFPVIELSQATKGFLKELQELNVPAGLITDGRSITQRNKLKALNIESFFNDIIISEEFGSEKPNEKNYLYFEEKYPKKDFYFFGDNTMKDFIIPAKLGWTTICIKNSGLHIHHQDLTRLPCPDYVISSFDEVELIPIQKEAY